MSGEPSPPDKHPAPASGAWYRRGWTNPRPWQASASPSPIWIAAGLTFLSYVLYGLVTAGPGQHNLIGILLTSLLLGLGAWKLLRLRRVWRAVRRHRRVLCFHCLYPLTDLGEAGRCPECGDPYTRDGLADKWREAESLLRGGRLVIPDPEPEPNDRPGEPDT